MRRLLLIFMLGAAALPASAAPPRFVHGARLPPTPSAPRPPPPQAAPAAPTLGIVRPARLALTGLAPASDRRAACRTDCARRRFRTDAADEDGGSDWGRCAAACDLAPLR